MPWILHEELEGLHRNPDPDSDKNQEMDGIETKSILSSRNYFLFSPEQLIQFLSNEIVKSG